MWETLVWSLGREDPLEKEMATHSSIHAWKIPRTKEPGGLQSMGSQRVGRDWATSLHFTSLQAYNDSTTFVISRHTLHVNGDRRLWAHQFSEAVASHSGLQMLNFSNILSEESPKIHCSTLKGDAGDTSAKELQHRSSDKNQTLYFWEPVAAGDCFSFCKRAHGSNVLTVCHF